MATTQNIAITPLTHVANNSNTEHQLSSADSSRVKKKNTNFENCLVMPTQNKLRQPAVDSNLLINNMANLYFYYYTVATGCPDFIRDLIV